MSIARKSVREAEICSHTHTKVFMGHLFPLLTLHGEEMGEKGGKERPSILSVLSLFLRESLHCGLGMFMSSKYLRCTALRFFSV